MWQRETFDPDTIDQELGWAKSVEFNGLRVFLQYLVWAKDAADLDLTLMYFHDVGFPPDSPLRGKINTVGWTLIGTQNQEIDCYGYYIAPELYRLGRLLGDDRYQELGKVIFDVKTQTISRPGRTFDLPLGCQGEHYNHSNCTYAPAAAGEVTCSVPASAGCGAPR